MNAEKSAMDEEWYWSKRGSRKQKGPVSRKQLEELAEAGDFGSEDLVWTEGMDDWKEAKSVEGLIDLSAGPPPLPTDPSGEKNEHPSDLSDGNTGKSDGQEQKTEKDKNEENISWRDFLTGLALLAVMGYIVNGCVQGCGDIGSGGSGIESSGSGVGSDADEIYAVDGISGNTAYMDYQLQADPRDLDGAMRSGWEVNFSRNLGEDVYYAVEDISESESVDVDSIRVMLTMDKCRNAVTGNVSTDVPSGSLVITNFGNILKSNSAEAFRRSAIWKGEWQSGILYGGFRECSGSFK